MNFKTLAKFIMVLGIVILAYGGIQFFTNLPEKFDPAKSQMTPWGGRDDFGHLLGVQSRNEMKEVKRASATKVMLGGAVVLFLGIGVSVSAKKKEIPS
ncbi:MAG: hypothetical protein QW838_07220 [Candidatus Nitrosotenuis sp.]